MALRKPEVNSKRSGPACALHVGQAIDIIRRLKEHILAGSLGGVEDATFWDVAGDLNQAEGDAYNAAKDAGPVANKRRPPKPKPPCGCS